jgi:hypothetical protein
VKNPPRPPRKHIPLWVKKAVVERQGGLCLCGCGAAVSWKPKTETHFDHEPALRLRQINRRGTDYIPPQHSIPHLDARCPASHRVKTSGSGATTAGTDAGKIKKERKRGKPPKPKRRWGSRPMKTGAKGLWPKRMFQKKQPKGPRL